MGSIISRPFVSAAMMLSVVTSVVTMGIYAFQKSLIYPSSFPEGSRTSVDTPDTVGIPYEDVTIETDDGETIKLFVMMQPESPTYVPKTVLMLGPNAGNMGHYLPLSELFYSEMKYNVVTVSYRGYGLSSGSPSEKGIKLDCEAIVKFLNEHPRIKDTSVILYGRSLGGAVSIYLASLPQATDLVRGIILENTFLSIKELIPGVFPILSYISFLCTELWETKHIIGKLSSSIPVLFLSGGRDELVPPSHMQTLYDLSSSSDKIIEVFPKGTHNDTYAQPDYWTHVANFIVDRIEPVEIGQ